ncbi:MAG: hypothetical protein J9259_03315 [Thermoplasmata archaeon YP2-bin.285]|uniref:Alpha-D-phosphohexomutase alpha/beta/alpha domain-containing protein n=1 Tax=Candidatus Sysuiplasma superficiale TaxID=2823368 RepID=A0A8J7YIV0_9ARCH|nr:hypothetical protein [Candidatus Sysuiplasma superficiale]
MRLYSWDRYEPLKVTRAGIAIAKFFGEGCTLATGRDGHPISRFTRRCIVSGLVTKGAQVVDFRVVPSQALRYGITRQKLEGAVYVSFYRGEVQIHVYTSDGKNLHAEGMLRIRELAEDTENETCSINDIGSLLQYTNGIEDYTEYLLSKVKSKIADRMLIDTQADPISLVVEPLMNRMGVECRIFNPMLIDNGDIRGKEEFFNELRNGKFDCGAIIERDELLGATFIDGKGENIRFASFEEMLTKLSERKR